jgi:predicted GH43/DUF377 family glycosyl hydrolase
MIQRIWDVASKELAMMLQKNNYLLPSNGKFCSTDKTFQSKITFFTRYVMENMSTNFAIFLLYASQLRTDGMHAVRVDEAQFLEDL